MLNMIEFSCPLDVHMTQESCWQVLDSLTSYPILEIELEDECELEHQFSDSSPILESMSTPVVLPKLSNIFEAIFILIISELESIISPIHNPFVDENQDSISFYQFELAQNFRTHIDILVSYPFPEIELKLESEPESQVGNSISLFDSIMTPIFLPDFFSIPESILNHVPVHCEIESPIFYDHISLMGKVCEHQFFDLDPIFEPILTPPFESRLDLSQIHESVSIFVPVPFESKSIISQIILHCWTKVLNKITQALFLKIKNWVGIIF